MVKIIPKSHFLKSTKKLNLTWYPRMRLRLSSLGGSQNISMMPGPVKQPLIFGMQPHHCQVGV
jgi:hypothetical protein